MDMSSSRSLNDDDSSSPSNSPVKKQLDFSAKIRLIPEGGWGWMICAAAFGTQLIVMGIHNSFGILYTTLLEEYKKTKAETAWVGSVSVGVMYLFGPITSGLSERFGCKIVAFLGGFLCILGLLLTSYATDLPKLYVTYGILWGIGSSFCYFPTLTAPGEYFCHRLSLVNGIVTAGSGIGTLAFGPVLQHILQRYGLVTSLRILSGVSVLLPLTSLTYKTFRSPLEDLFEIKKQPGPFFDLSVWQNKAFCVYTGAVALFMLGYFIPYVHLVSHVEGLGISPSKAALLIGFMSIASTISRVIFGKFSDHPKVNRLFMTQLAITGFGVTTTLCPVAKDYASLVTIVVFLGLFDGLYVVLIAVVNTDIVGVHKLSAALGSVYGVISITLTVGPPFAGLMFDTLHSYHTVFYICGATSTLSACLMFLIPWLMPNQQGGAFRRDSALSRLESLLSSLPPTPRRISRRNFAHDSQGSGTGDSDDGRGGDSLCEADRIEMEFLQGSVSNDVEDDDQDGGTRRPDDGLRQDTSINTVFNSTMSHRGSITKFLLQQQLQSWSRSPSPLSDSCRGSGQGNQSSRGDSSRSSLSSYFGGSRRASCSTSSKSKSSSKPTPTGSIRDSVKLGESTSEETSELNSDELEPEIDETTVDFLHVDALSRRISEVSTVVASCRESGQSTVVCSNRSSVVKVALSPKVSLQEEDSQQQRSVKDPDMLHVLAARLLQATREKENNFDGKELKESVV